MAMDAKVSFMNQLEEKLADVLTVDQMARLRTTAAGIMEHFDMTEMQMLDASDDDLLSCYLDTMKVQNRSERTIHRYEYEITRMMKDVKVPTRRITVYHLRNYLAKEQARGIRDSTMEGLRQVFSAYFNWLQRESLIEKNPCANLGPIKVAKKEKKIYSQVEIEKLVRGCKGYRKIRNVAIIHFLASTGCRISEMTGLDRGSVNLDSLECVVHGKGDKERTVFMSEVAGMALKEYLETRKDDGEALFAGFRGERLQPGGVREMLKEIAKRMNVENVHPHKFRRTLATEMSRRGMQLHQISKLLGHEKIDTTMSYVMLNKEDVKNSYRRYA